MGISTHGVVKAVVAREGIVLPSGENCPMVQNAALLVMDHRDMEVCMDRNQMSFYHLDFVVLLEMERREMGARRLLVCRLCGLRIGLWDLVMGNTPGKFPLRSSFVVFFSSNI